MSLLDDDRPTNPAKHFLQVKSGAISYYDKEEGQNVEVPTPFKFVVLDTLATVKGWSNEAEAGIWSNEVKSVGDQVLNVRTKNGIIASGLWKDIKDEVVADGGKYHSAIYLAAQGRESMEIQCLTVKGAVLTAWIEFTKKNDIRKNSVTITEWKEEGKAVKYKVPVFVAEPMTDVEKEEAVELAKELRAYHNEYFNSAKKVQEEDSVTEDIEDEPINVDDIPF